MKSFLKIEFPKMDSSEFSSDCVWWSYLFYALLRFTLFEPFMVLLIKFGNSSHYDVDQTLLRFSRLRLKVEHIVNSLKN